MYVTLLHSSSMLDFMFSDNINLIVHPIIMFLLVIISYNHKGIKVIDVIYRIFGI